MRKTKWSNTGEALELLANQRQVWPALRNGYEALGRAKVKPVCIDNEFTVKVQYNPARIISSAAEPGHIDFSKRPCFLCSSHLPPEQKGLPMGKRYVLLCNPYPIFPEHFTVASLEHTPQLISDSFPDFLQTARSLSGLTVFYNGPQSGASAPDHLHFQAVTRGYMPLDTEIVRYKRKLLFKTEDGTIHLLSGYRRNGFVQESTEEEGACNLFGFLHGIIRSQVEGNGEPRMNIFCRYDALRGWQIIVFPRKAHRPQQFYAKGDERILTSPGAADMGGVFVTTREEDFEKMSAALLCDIYDQIAYGDEEDGMIDRLAEVIELVHRHR